MSTKLSKYSSEKKDENMIKTGYLEIVRSGKLGSTEQLIKLIYLSENEITIFFDLVFPIVSLSNYLRHTSLQMKI